VRSAVALGITPDARALLLMFIGLFVLRILTQFAGQTLTLYLSKRLLAQLATQAFTRLVTAVPLNQVEKATIGSYITLVGDESFRASNLVAYLNQFLGLGVLATLYYIAIAIYSPVVALGVLVFLIVTFVLLFESFKVSHRLGGRQVDQSQAATTLFVDSLNNLRSVRAFCAEGYVAASYHEQIWQYIRTLFAVDMISLLTRLGPALLLLGTVAVVAAWPAMSASLSSNFPFVVTIVIFLMRFFPVVGQTLNLALRLVADARSGRDVTHLVTGYGDNLLHGATASPQLRNVETVEVVGVGFSYDPDKHVLKDVEMRLQRGRSYALVGLSGSGKSTLLDLLLGFYAMEYGRLLINGLPIEKLNHAELRAKVLLLSQDTAIFNDTVANNLRFGSRASAEEVERACRIACIDDFIATLPQGYATRLSYRGSNLSGGQKQRIGIARAVLRRPDLLLLDESTSALDAETRARVVDNLLAEFRDRIVLFVTHDAFVMSRVSEVIDMAAINRAAAEAAAERAASSGATRVQ
jgi:ABC-type bacteriocin/lantibiotic exporter with double-glycine peptidase domain